MANQEKKISSGRNDDELDALLSSNAPVKEAESEEDSVYVPKLRIRKKKKGENLRALGSRVPTYMIDDLKMLADYHETNVEDMVAGVLESLLEDNMEAVYRKKEAELRKLRKMRNS
ncbi:hypothetical protein N7I40_004038 [Vibrio parahaemolyticus]|uniref:hypothetical protein n=1 Tax=Vibrio harveyi group TaxID=717610 RepID=UPI00063DC382|nr:MULTISPECIES: hypothetical protein [Vibrio harveyi group]EGR3221667.1 hypothetical protein [Vibrio parahaemolyticus]EHK6545781.1 hypothetical protein [Vibrio parahaemolyticus]EJL8716090.1 hypothetical protein [Vibrio alginolyticus]EJV5946412.1 hypothetical protein [Vibrio parahaemolyticus]EKN4564913.1 hypothetical protein [Vibrio parahaemolyticus]